MRGDISMTRPSFMVIYLRLLHQLKEWWRRKTEPATVGTHQGETVLQRRVCHCISAYYDQDGWLIGFYYTLNTEPERFVPSEYRSRMPVLARLRSPDITNQDEPTIAY
jgi:hypothetical protein